VYYTNAGTKGQTFFTVSDSLNHGPAGIWIHLKPILKGIKNDNPGIKRVEIFSDGPTTQYKQKGNFYLFATALAALRYEEAAWNLFEAGHGKGVPDAVGGSIKRNADQKVKYGRDITSPKTFVEL
jgi:hypothetical protein